MSAKTGEDLLWSILAMDSYNQAYGAKLEHGATQIGSATPQKDPKPEVKETWKSAGFYADAHKLADDGRLRS